MSAVRITRSRLLCIVCLRDRFPLSPCVPAAFLLSACVVLIVAAASSPLAASVVGPSPIAPGHYVYHDRDGHLLPLLATLTCMGDCDGATPAYRATLQFTSVLLGNSRLVGFGAGPAPQIIGGCSNDNFTVILEDDDFASGNIFAASGSQRRDTARRRNRDTGRIHPSR